MEIRSEDHQSRITLTIADKETEHYASVALNVRVHGPRIAVQGIKVWIADASIAAFVEQLQELDRIRAGKAVLCGMSPGEFEIVVEAIGKKGHLIASVSISKSVSVGDPPVTRNEAAAVHFALDPTTLAALSQDLQGLLAGSSAW